MNASDLLPDCWMATICSRFAGSLEGLQDRSRRPQRYANQLPFQVERSILQFKRAYPNWGAPKIREKLIREYPTIKPTAKSTVHAVLERHGL
jgi:putative transposase